MSVACQIHTAFPAAHQRRGPAGVPVAALLPEPPVIDPRTLMLLADACDRAADPILVEATDMEAVVASAPGWPGITTAAADRLARGLRLKDAAQHLRDDAHDAELQAWLAHRAAGGDVVLAPLPVVVGDAQRAAAPANDRAWSWRAAAASLFRRTA